MNYNDMFISKELRGAYSRPPMKATVLREVGLSPRSGHPEHKPLEMAFSKKDKGRQVANLELEFDFDSDD